MHNNQQCHIDCSCVVAAALTRDHAHSVDAVYRVSSFCVVSTTVPVCALSVSCTALPVASNSRLAIQHATEQAKELCHEFQSPRCTFVISIATAKLPAWSHHVRAITQ